MAAVCDMRINLIVAMVNAKIIPLRSVLQSLVNLLLTRSEERGVLGAGSIPVAILSSCQNVKTFALQLHKHKYSWVVKIIKEISEAKLRSQYSPWSSY